MDLLHPIFPQGKRYHSFAAQIKERFGGRLQKVVIDLGFNCPNRDGTLGTEGCTYCLNAAFHPAYSRPDVELFRQINEGILFHQRRYARAKGYLAYFQSYSNTYAPLERLKEVYEQALTHPNICGLVIGTRPDCVDAEKLDYIAELSLKSNIIIEFGVESCHDRTLLRIKRGHTFTQAREAVIQSAQRGLQTGAHFIFGLPGESKEEMMRNAAIINTLPLTSVKFHQLQIIKGTAMEKEYLKYPNDFVTFTLPDYIDFFIDFLELLHPKIAIERFAGEVPPRFVSHTPWGLVRNVDLIRMLEKRLAERNSWQGQKLVMG
ncbi:MAG: TIGR01212 family radical SAM protein [Prevotellaceae bacterium]|nr:TIGR01212 family radical SAM protein [Prevotellaceae bacterium]